MDRSTALKKQLDYVKICVDVEAKTVLPASITVDFGNGNCVDVGVELDWAPLCCSNCVIFGHSTDNCKKHVVSNTNLQVEHIPSQVVQDSMGGIDHGSLVSGSVEAVVSGAGLGVELGVVSPQAVQVDGVGEVSSAQLVPGSVPPSFGQTLEDERVDLVSGQDGVFNISANKFEVLCAVVDDQVVKDVLTRPERVAAGGVAELMEKLKPKEKGRVAKKKRERSWCRQGHGFRGWCFSFFWMTMLVWNVRGFNDPLKQKRVLGIARKLDIEILGLLETRVQVSNAAYIVQNRFGGWMFFNNYLAAPNGRIWILIRGAWKFEEVSSTSQAITCCLRMGDDSFYCSFVYACNGREDRRELWRELIADKLELELGLGS
ncbi:hypothetical protein V6N13_080715 [Hibiscus sabdariffa]